jgi:transcriptional regulator with XRE-family HTH domain
MGGYLRRLRQERGWTIRELARRVGLTDSAAGYLSQLETSDKIPNTDLAVRLVEILGDPKGVFILWSRIGRRSDPYEAGLARRELALLLSDSNINYDPRFQRPGTTRFERYQGLMPTRGMRRSLPLEPDAQEGGSLIEDIGRRRIGNLPNEPKRYRIPILPEGADPKTAVARAKADPATEFVRLDLEAFQDRLFLPFAYRLTQQSVHRVSSVLKPGDVAVFSQVAREVNEHEIYAIRLGDQIELAHAMWNHRELLLLPDAGRSDFIVMPANELALAELIAGHMITVVQKPPQP